MNTFYPEQPSGLPPEPAPSRRDLRAEVATPGAGTFAAAPPAPHVPAPTAPPVLTPPAPGSVTFPPAPAQVAAAQAAAAQALSAHVGAAPADVLGRPAPGQGGHPPAGTFTGAPAPRPAPAPAGMSYAQAQPASPVPQTSTSPAPVGAPAPAGAPSIGAQPGTASYAPAQRVTFHAPPGQSGPPAPDAPPVAQPVAAPAAPAPAAPRGPAPRGGERNARMGMTQLPGEGDLDLDEALKRMIELGASDLHVTVGAPPSIRLDGRLTPLEGFPSLLPDTVQRTMYAVLTQKQRETFEANLELDFAYAVRGVSRFRVNMYKQRDSLGAAFRVIPYEIKPLEALGVPPIVGTFAGMPRGLVLVTGPTGSGKSTTLAAIIDLANRTRSDHIMTVEDPIEFLHRHKKSLINQREVGADTHSFANALKHVLRQDPDIILVGELRDLETISVALTAAETGHLVFATLHTQDAAQTIDRIIDVFPAHQQEQVRTQLAGALQGVICQTLCARSDAPGRVVATEVLTATPGVRNLIREGKTHQIYSAMQAGAKQGMHTLDQALAELVKAGKITYEVGLEKCHHVEDYNRLTGRFSGGSQGSAGMAGDPFAGPAFGGGH